MTFDDLSGKLRAHHANVHVKNAVMFEASVGRNKMQS